MAPGLSIQEKGIIEARQSLRITAIKKVDFEVALYEAITRVYFRLRFAMPLNNDIKAIVQLLITDLNIYATTLTIAEIELAFKNGCLGLYGEFHGVSNATLMKWVMNYMISNERKEAIKKQQDFEKPEEKQLTQEEKDRIMMDAFEKAKKIFKETGTYNDIGNSLYKWLDKRGEIKFTKEEKWKFVEQARQKLLETVDLLSAKDGEERRLFEKLIEEYEVKNSDPVIVEGMKIAFVEYLKKQTQ
jgi:hypothetical protein